MYNVHREFPPLMFSSSFMLMLIIASIFVIFLFLVYTRRRGKLRLPPGPWGLPFVGYLPFLGKEPFRTFDNLSKKYGNIFSLYLGGTLVVVLGDYPAVKEAFSKQETTGRPPELFSFIPDGIGISGLNGQEWVEQRRFSIKVLKSLAFSRSRWVRLVEEEVTDFIRMIRSRNGRPIDISKLLLSSISSNIAYLLLGKKLPFGDPNEKFLNRGVEDVVRVFAPAGLYGYFPWIVNLLVKLGIGDYAKSSEIAKYFYNYIRKEIDLHRRRKAPMSKDFIEAYLEEMEMQQKINKFTTFNERNLIGNTETLFIGGSDPIPTTLNWLIMAMAAYPDVQKKVHIELDTVLGEEQRASWEDRSKFPYIYAVLMENNRWKTTVPVNTSHTARENIKLGNFDIPKGTTIIANNWSVHNDTRYWKEPDKFIPERFLLKEGTAVNLRPESYVPFSHGKRNCPGETMSMMEIFLYFTSLMRVFEVRTPSGESPRMDAILGLLYKPIPQELCFIPRSPETKVK